ncbi:MAG: tetratricopeptide repeat protein [bacterium]|nr:tetratricopeptide repeat protein [bacterium]
MSDRHRRTLRRSLTLVAIAAMSSQFSCDARLEPNSPSELTEVQSEVQQTESTAEVFSDDRPDLSVPRPDFVEPAMSVDVTASRELAEQALADGRIEEAYDHARAAYRHGADDPLVMFVMARVLGERHRFEEAIAILDSVALRDPQARLPTLGQTAQWMVLKGDWNQAEKRYKAILDEVPGFAMVHEEIALLNLRQGRRHGAASHIRQLCQSGTVKEHWMLELLSISDDPFPMNGSEENEPIGSLGMAQNLIAQGSRDGAIKTLINHPRKLLDAERSLLGRLLALEEDQEALTQWSEEMVLTNESNADAWFATASLHQMRGEHAKAVTCFCEAILRDATDDVGYQRLSQSLQELAMDAAAKRVSERAKLVHRTKMIGDQIRRSADGKYKPVVELVGLLEQLHRQDESLAWNSIAVANSGRPKNEVQQAILEINEQRLRHLESESFEIDPSFAICGLDLDDFPNVAD